VLEILVFAGSNPEAPRNRRKALLAGRKEAMLNFFKKVWAKITSVAKSMWEGIKKAFKKVLHTVKSAAKKVKGIFTKKRGEEQPEVPEAQAKKSAPTPKQDKSKNSNKSSAHAHREKQQARKEKVAV